VQQQRRARRFRGEEEDAQPGWGRSDAKQSLKKFKTFDQKKSS
jgi:hypothetical protein